jgi:hypothetical protein
VIARNLAGVRDRIAAAARRAGRDPDSIRLVAVSKRKPPEAIREAYGAGARDFGENYVRELVEKAGALEDLGPIRWHLVGHLQRNKAAEAIRVANVVHTIDSVRLADAIRKRVTRPLDVLIEVNVAGEAQKSGCRPAEVGEILAVLAGAPLLTPRGLMTVPPLSEDPQASRPHFRALRALRDAHGLSELSMGMTADLEVAVEEGATIVRVGTAIFGDRG